MKTSSLTTLIMLLSTAVAYHINQRSSVMDVVPRNEISEESSLVEVSAEKAAPQIDAPTNVEAPAPDEALNKRQTNPTRRPDSIVITFTPPTNGTDPMQSPGSPSPTGPSSIGSSFIGSSFIGSSPTASPISPPLLPGSQLTTCSVDPNFNRCTAARQTCTFFPPVPGYNTSAGQCVCQAGYKPASGGIRLAYPGYEYLVLAPPGSPCNTQCTTLAPAPQVCGEVPGPYGTSNRTIPRY